MNRRVLVLYQLGGQLPLICNMRSDVLRLFPFDNRVRSIYYYFRIWNILNLLNDNWLLIYVVLRAILYLEHALLRITRLDIHSILVIHYILRDRIMSHTWYSRGLSIGLYIVLCRYSSINREPNVILDLNYLLIYYVGLFYVPI